MNILTKRIVYLIPLLLSGCLTRDTKKADIMMPQMQQNTYLSDAKPPQQFGFEVVPIGNGFTYLGRARLHPNNVAKATLRKGNIPIVKMRGRSRHKNINVLIDVSSPASWIEFSESQKLDAQFLGLDEEVIPYRGRYNTGGAKAYAGVITQLRIDQLFMENIPFYIRMAHGSLGPLARGIHVPHINAVMGYDNLKNFEFIQFDLKNRRIIFSSTTPYTPKKELLIATAHIVPLPDHGLAIAGSIFNQPTPIILDFSGNFNFARGDARVNITKQIGLGDVVFRQVPTLILPEHNSPPRAGRKMLEPYLITICSKQGVVYFERPPL